MLAYICRTLNIHKSSKKQHQGVQDPTSQAMIQTPHTSLEFLSGNSQFHIYECIWHQGVVN